MAPWGWGRRDTAPVDMETRGVVPVRAEALGGLRAQSQRGGLRVAVACAVCSGTSGRERFWGARWGLGMRVGSRTHSSLHPQAARGVRPRRTAQDVVHASASAQWLAGRPGHSFGGGPRGRHSFRTRLGPHLHEDGRGSVQHRREGKTCAVFALLGPAARFGHEIQTLVPGAMPTR